MAHGLKRPRRRVDTDGVTRAFALVSLLAVLGVGAYLYAGQGREAVAPDARQAAQQAAAGAAADATLLGARTGVEAFLAANGTYAGAPVPTGVSLVAVDATSYCLQVGAGATARHVTSPGTGSTQPGPC